MGVIFGVLFHWIGGLASGSFYVPFRKVKVWSWETYWLVSGVASWIIAPWFFASILGPNPIAILQDTSSQVLSNTFICGLLWGIGGLTFGLSMRYLGMSLGMAIALGFCTAFGTLIPPIKDGTFMAEVWAPSHGKVVLLGILVCLIGIGIAGKAGMEKEKGLSDEEKKAAIKEFDFKKGLFIAIFSGIMSAFFAFGFAAGEGITHISTEHGASSHWAGLPVLIVIMAGGFITNIAWCIFLHIKNGSAKEYFSSKPIKVDDSTPLAERPTKVPLKINYIFSMMAGVIWYFQFFFYQIGESYMGQFKFSSWTLHMASIIIFSSIWGIKLGEWKGSSKKSMNLLYTSLGMLILSTVIIGIGAWMKGGSAGGH